MVFVSGKVEIERADTGLAKADVEDAVFLDPRLDGDRIACKGLGQLDVPAFEADPALLLDLPDGRSIRIRDRRQDVREGARAWLITAGRVLSPSASWGRSRL
jgi:hypothetical protein